MILKTPTLNLEGYHDICDGYIYRNDNELEICNPLGSNAGIHKVHVYYYTI